LFAIRAALPRLCRVIAFTSASEALSQWKQRSKKNWTVKVDAELVKKYAELAELPDLVPPPMYR
jgi:hypothetical protein